MKAKSSQMKYCDRCEAELPLGSTKYKVRVEITSDFDGYLPASDFEDDEERSRFLEKIAKLDQNTMEDQVHMEINLLLCPACRQRFIEDLDLATDGKPMRKSKAPIRLH